MSYFILIDFDKYIQHKQTLKEEDIQHYIRSSIYFILEVCNGAICNIRAGVQTQLLHMHNLMHMHAHNL